MTIRKSDLRINESVTCSRDVQSTAVGQKGGVTGPERGKNVWRA